MKVSSTSKRLLAALVSTLALAGSAHAELLDRGNGLVYDSTLNITWLKDWNYAKSSGHDADGLMTWDDAQTWANTLTYGGYSDWRLPSVVDTGTPGCNFSPIGGTDCGYNPQTANGAVYSEMAHLFYQSLGNKAFVTPGTGVPEQPGWGLVNTGPFINLQPYDYWSGTPFAPDTRYAWYFSTTGGFQGFEGGIFDLYAVAVRPGDVTAAVTPIPEPGTWALMLLGLAAVAAAVRRKGP